MFNFRQKYKIDPNKCQANKASRAMYFILYLGINFVYHVGQGKDMSEWEGMGWVVSPKRLFSVLFVT